VTRTSSKAGLSDSKPRDSGASSFGPTENPFLVHRNKLRLYEYSANAAVLGPSFVARCCAVVRAQRLEAGVNHRTWVNNYVMRLGEVLRALESFCASGSPSGRLPDQYTPADWRAFIAHLNSWIHAQPWAEGTRSRVIDTTNKLLTILHREGPIGSRVELPIRTARNIAKVGQSRFTVRGWSWKPRANRVESPYVFHLEKTACEYDYSAYRDVGRLFVLHATARLKEYYATCSPDVAKDNHACWTDLLRHLQASRGQQHLDAFHRQLGSDEFRAIPTDVWEGVLYGWREGLHAKILSGERKAVTQNARVARLNRVWADLAGVGLVPRVRIKGFKNAKSQYLLKPRATLAQLSVLDRATDAAVRSASEHLATFFNESDQDEARDYLRSLSQALSPEVVRGLPVEAIIEEIHRLNERRLNLIRRCAEADFRLWHAHWCRGQAAFEACALDGEALIALLDGPALSASEVRANSSRLLKTAPEQQRLGNALRYIDARYEGSICGINGRVHHLARSFGGRGELMAYLHPHEHATLALWVLMLVDTGANCEVARATPWECLQPSKRPGSKRLVMGPKHRAGGLVIVDELEESRPDGSLSLPTAIQMYQSMASRFHARAEPGTARLLLLHDVKGRPQALAEWKVRAWFVGFLARHDDLSNLDARPSMIRPSVLMDIQHRNGGRVAPAQAVGDHASASTTLQHYTGRIPIKLLYTLNIREFQERLQSVIIVTIDGAAAKLGISEAQLRTLFSEAARTGLGVACLDPLAGIQPGTRQGHPCTRWDECWNCRMRWVVATVDNVADLILFNEHLQSTANAGADLPAADWEERWLPWLAFTEVALQKLREGEAAGLYAQAVALAQERRITYTGIPLG
jgi:hypothetical protein